MRTVTPRLRATQTGNRSSSTRLRAQRVAEGVVASYIHDISARHSVVGPPGSSAWLPRSVERLLRVTASPRPALKPAGSQA